MKKTEKSLSDRLQDLRDEAFATIRKEMERIGRNLVDEEFEQLEFASYSDTNENNIIGINAEGELISSFDENPIMIEDDDSEFGNFVALAEELAEIK